MSEEQRGATATDSCGILHTVSPRLEKKIPATFTFESDDPEIATVTSKGVVRGVKAGYVQITIHAKPNNPNYTANLQMASIQVVKAANAKTGNVTVKKGLKEGTYNVTVKVRAKGNAEFKASAWKKVTFRVNVK